MQSDFALAQLNPVGEQGIVFIDFVGELPDICKAFLSHLGSLVVALHEHAHFIDDAVDEWRDTVDERHLGTVVRTLTGIFTGFHLAHQPLLIDFINTFLSQLTIALLFLLPLSQGLQKVVEFVFAPVLAREMIKEPQEEEQQYNGGDHHHYHNVELRGCSLQLGGSRLEIAVLTGVLL